MPEPLPFVPGHEYRRRIEIHGQFGGQQQGGISSPKDHPYVFIFTGDAGTVHGYEDGYTPDGTFEYTGEGQVGDMKMERGNRAIYKHQANGSRLLLFSEVRKAVVRFEGEFQYIGHRYEERPDREGRRRQAIIFELDVVPGEAGEPVPPRPARDDRSSLWSTHISECRQRALAAPPSTQDKKQRLIASRKRSEAVRIYVLRRANGVCECCGSAAPFNTAAGRPYLEPHHIRRLADEGPDHPRWVAAICPNCHRRVHYGEDGKELNQRLADKLAMLEPDL